MTEHIITIAVPAAAVFTGLGAVAGKFADGWWKRRRNGSGPLSKDDHKELCSLNLGPIKQRLEGWDQQFRDVSAKIDDNHREIIGILLNNKREE
jgi:hypothetical protein